MVKIIKKSQSKPGSRQSFFGIVDEKSNPKSFSGKSAAAITTGSDAGVLEHILLRNIELSIEETKTAEEMPQVVMVKKVEVEALFV